jgi:hypothetical protein
MHTTMPNHRSETHPCIEPGKSHNIRLLNKINPSMTCLPLIALPRNAFPFIYKAEILTCLDNLSAV